MMSNPKPLKTIRTLFGERAIMKPNARGIEDANLLESY